MFKELKERLLYKGGERGRERGRERKEKKREEEEVQERWREGRGRGRRRERSKRREESWRTHICSVIILHEERMWFLGLFLICPHFLVILY